MPQTNGELLKATLGLTQEVRDLSGRLSAKELLHKRTRMLTFVAIFIGVFSIIGTSAAFTSIYQNAKNAKTTCLNSNQIREAQSKIWGFVYESNKSDPETTEHDRQAIERLEKYTNEVFAQRDCNDLSKKYKLPPPPVPPELGQRRINE